MFKGNKEEKTSAEEIKDPKGEKISAEEKKAPRDEKKSSGEEKKRAEKPKGENGAGQQIAALKEQIETLEGRIAKEKDDYIRLMAEFDNFRRRTSQEKLDLVNFAAEETIKGLLPILDDFERAVDALKASDDCSSAKEGTELIYNKLTGYLKSKGLNPIEAKGLAFDTDLHEAVAQFPAGEESDKGKIIDVVQTGYTLNGKVIRFAKVVVGI